MVNVGQRKASARIAHLLCEIVTRLVALGACDRIACAFPLTQSDLAEATGLSVVHVNRTLRTLKEQELVSVRDRQLTILDWDGLVEAGDFLPDYLHLSPQVA